MPSCFRPACRSRGHRKEIVWAKQLAIPDRSTEAWHTRERLKPNAVSYGLSEVTRSTIILFDCRHAVSVRYTVHVYLVGPLAMISQSRAAKKLPSDRCTMPQNVSSGSTRLPLDGADRPSDVGGPPNGPTSRRCRQRRALRSSVRRRPVDGGRDARRRHPWPVLRPRDERGTPPRSVGRYSGRASADVYK